MKLFTAVFLTVLAGAGLGYATAVAEFGIETRIPQFDQPIVRPPKAPRVYVDETVHDFGSMYLNHEDQHVFIVRNTGNAVLELEKGKKSCKCTTFQLARSTVAPGESVEVTVGWKTTTRWRERKWGQTATLKTNDPSTPQVKLRIEGHLIPEYRFSERALVMGPLSVRDSASIDIPLIFYTSPDVEVTDISGLPDVLKEHLKVEYRPLSEDEMLEHESEDVLKPEAKRGYMISATLKPGLEPRSRMYRSQLSVATTPKLKRTVYLPVEITVQPDVQLHGFRVPYLPERKLLNMGVLPVGKGFQGRLQLVLSGADSREFEVKVKEKVPADLEVTFGEQKNEHDNTNRRPMFVKLPETAQPMSMLGDEKGEMGYVLLETTHPHVPEFRLNVRVAVQ